VLDLEQGTVEFFTLLNHNISNIKNFPCFLMYQTPQEKRLDPGLRPGAVYGYSFVGYERDVIAPVDWQAGEWHHVAFSWDPKASSCISMEHLQLRWTPQSTQLHPQPVHSSWAIVTPIAREVLTA